MERIGMLNPMSIRYPADLPTTARREEIVGAIRANQVLILAGETGSGKTTQLPKMCLEAAGEHARGVTGCTQTWRVAAKVEVESAFGATA
jgi:ATP-dependent helicase HrpA